jgi:hypothetical protein
MQFQQAPMPMRTMNRSSPETAMPANTEPSTKEIPYDYVATFKLNGEFGKRVQDVINISVEGAFVAVAIGYSFIPALTIKNDNVLVPPSQGPIVTVSPLNSYPLLSLIEPFVCPSDNSNDPCPSIVPDSKTRKGQRLQLIKMISECFLVKLCGIQFKYSIVDSGSGRELQNQPIHNIAGLGESNGDRPFRPLAKPMIFMPRSTIRIEIEEISTGPLYEGAQLYFVLHGYKILGYGTGLP